MRAWDDPGFVGHARRIGTAGNVLTAALHDANLLLLFLRQNIAEDATLLALVVLAAGAQLVEHAARHKRRRRELPVRMVEFLTAERAMVLKDGDVFKSAVALEINDALGGEPEKLLDFRVAGVPKIAVVARIFNQHLVRSYGAHVHVEAVFLAVRFTFASVNRRAMPHTPCPPGATNDR